MDLLNCIVFCVASARGESGDTYNKLHKRKHKLYQYIHTHPIHGTLALPH